MSRSSGIIVRESAPSDRSWVEQQLRRSWGSTTVISRGRAHTALDLPALIAVESGAPVGLVTFCVADGECELVTLDALHPSRGIGSALLARVVQQATQRSCRRLWLVTTNDNLDAVRFYQRRGMRLAAVHRGSVDEARRLKPSISAVGCYGIAIHDELELDMELGTG